MSSFRELKKNWKNLILDGHWQEVRQAALALPGREAVGPLISFLPQIPELKWWAVYIFGQVVAQLANRDLESARVVMRQLMWQLNEESGNLGWGIPEAFGAALAWAADYPEGEPARRLPQEYSRILHSYIRQTGREDNYCEHGPMRRGAFWAVGRFCAAQPTLAHSALVRPMFDSLLAGLEDEEPTCRGMAAWALQIFQRTVGMTPEQCQAVRDKLPPLCAPEQSNLSVLDLLDGEGWDEIRQVSIRQLAEECLAAVGG